MSAAARPYTNPATQREKQEIFRNEQQKLKRGDREPTTLHQLSRLGLDEEPQGRFAQSRHISGSAPSVEYPAASSPWTAGNDAGLEPPLNQDVNFVEPCGEQWEIERELGGLEAGAMAQGTHAPPCVSIDSPLENAVEVSSPPLPQRASPHAEQRRSSAKLDADGHAISTPAVSIPTTVETDSVANPAQPDDGLDDVPRRADGWPLSSHAPAPKPKRRKL
jgi:hypothetical protein